MVLYKRKPVQFLSRPALYDDQEIWIIPQTEEIFTNYNDYLVRIEFYRQKRFICEITGHSGLDYFTAQRNEMEAQLEVDDSFPKALREPILRKVQHETISRIDILVDHVFDEFKQDFFPGEDVTVMIEPDTKLHQDLECTRVSGKIREKIRFPEIRRADGTVEREAFARYFVRLADRPDEEAVADADHLVRDRRTFTKQILRSYLKNSLYREAWSGAPWQVKDYLARDFRIPTEIPHQLSYEFQLAQRKANLNSKKGEYDGTLLNFFGPHNGPQNRLPEIKPKSLKGKLTQHDAARLRQQQFMEYQRTLVGTPGFEMMKDIPPDHNDPQFLQYISQHPRSSSVAAKSAPKPAPTPTIKYTIEDLELPPVRDGNNRPAFKFLCKAPDIISSSSPDTSNPINMHMVGPLLETWNTLNVFCEVFILDSFTFDDFTDALRFESEEVQSELLVEIHCAVLSKLVNSEKELDGRVNINLPAAYQDESDGDSSTQASKSKTPSPEPEVQKRTTRSSLAKSEAAELKAAAAIEAKVHLGAEIDQCIRGYGWRARLRKRDFAGGKWVVIVVGLLNLFCSTPRLRKNCEEMLMELAPVNMEPTETTAISQYANLDINARVRILQFLCALSLDTTAIRGYMEECTASMTQFRKEKIEWQRARKAAIEDLKALDGERRALQPDTTSPVPELEELEELDGMEELDEELEDVKTTEPDDEGDTMGDTEDEDPVPQRSLRRANDRAADRKKRLEEDRKRKEKAEVEKAKKPTKEARQLEKVMKKIEDLQDKIKECENEMAICDNDLRESDCHRTRCLGIDRFWNRYYWFERNAMPYGGMPDSSTVEAGYANACIWVQGPDDVERLGFIELNEVENAQYRHAFSLSVPERKMIEEGPTHTFTAHEWGYYDDPDQLDKLISWLDAHGRREFKLRKEMVVQREKITHNMVKRKEYLTKAEEKRSASAEPTTRFSTRSKSYTDRKEYRFMAWTNSTAMTEQGHLHSEPIGRPKRGVGRVVRKKEIAAMEEEGRQTRGSNRVVSGKLPTRQGTRYNF